MIIGNNFLYNCSNFSNAVLITDYLESVGTGCFYNCIKLNKFIFDVSKPLNEIFIPDDYSFSIDGNVYNNTLIYTEGFLVICSHELQKEIIDLFPELLSINPHRIWNFSFLFSITKEDGSVYIVYDDEKQLENLSTLDNIITLNEIGIFTIDKATEAFSIRFNKNSISTIPNNFLNHCNLTNTELIFLSKVKEIEYNAFEETIFKENTKITFRSDLNIIIGNNFGLNSRGIQDINFISQTVFIQDNFLCNTDFNGEITINDYKLIEKT